MLAMPAGSWRGYALIWALLLSMPALSGQAPETIVGATVVSAEELIDLVTKRADVVLIDARLAGDYLRGHIDGAINLPNTETNCHTLVGIIPQRSTPLVFYCNGETCLRSAKSVRIARSCGYVGVYWFRGGFAEWLTKGYPYLKK